MPVEIFVCYARKDQKFLHNLKAHLMPFQRQGSITIWSDADINAGRKWEEEIDKHLNTADIILLLVSPDFMNSDYCYSVEMKRAMERHDNGEACVIPVILRPVHWQGMLGKLQVLPRDALPVTDPLWSNVDRAFFNVAIGIRNIVEQLEITRQFVKAYWDDSDIVLSSIVEEIERSPYQESFVFTPQEQERIRVALHRKAALEHFRESLTEGNPQKIVDASTRDFFEDEMLTDKDRDELELARHLVQEYANRSFQDALKDGRLQQIVKTYDLLLNSGGKASEEEHVQVSLARHFLEAYNTDDDEDFITAYNEILASPYNQICFSVEEQERISQAQLKLKKTSLLPFQQLQQPSAWGQPTQQPTDPWAQPVQQRPTDPWAQPVQQQPSAWGPLAQLDAPVSQNRMGILRIEEGKEPGRIYEVRKESISIGRSNQSDIFLEDLAVSRLHARIVSLGSSNYAIEDAGSANGTKVNGQLVIKYQTWPLQEGDKIQVGTTVFVFAIR